MSSDTRKFYLGARPGDATGRPRLGGLAGGGLGDQVEEAVLICELAETGAGFETRVSCAMSQ